MCSRRRPCQLGGMRIRLAAILSLVSACGGSSLSSEDNADARARRAAVASKIKHVFIIFKENHTFDNYFATFPGAEGATFGLRSNGDTIQLSQPFTDLWYPGSNSFSAAHTDWNGGAMDGFDKGEPFPGVHWYSPGPYVTYAPADGTPGGPA